MAKKKKYPKKPTAPKKTATVEQHQAYAKKHAEWLKACREVDAENKKQATAAANSAKLSKVKHSAKK